MTGRQQGMILFNTMMMISVFTLLIVSQMQIICLQFKSFNHVLFRHQSFQKLNVQAHRLVAASLAEGWPSGSCLIQESKGADELMERLKRNEGCRIVDEKQQYYYFIEDLGLFPCLQITRNNIHYSTRHWRLTIMAIIRQRPITLQLRIAMIAEPGICVDNPPISVDAGIISWRNVS